MPRSSELPLPFRLSIQYFVCNFHLSSACYMSCPSPLDLTILTVFDDDNSLRVNMSSIIKSFLPVTAVSSWWFSLCQNQRHSSLETWRNCLIPLSGVYPGLFHLFSSHFPFKPILFFFET
jgi:hypothetical protein